MDRVTSGDEGSSNPLARSPKPVGYFVSLGLFGARCGPGRPAVHSHWSASPPGTQRAPIRWRVRQSLWVKPLLFGLFAAGCGPGRPALHSQRTASPLGTQEAPIRWRVRRSPWVVPSLWSLCGRLRARRSRGPTSGPVALQSGHTIAPAPRSIVRPFFPALLPDALLPFSPRSLDALQSACSTRR